MRLLIGFTPQASSNFDFIGKELQALKQVFQSITEIFEAEGDLNFVILVETSNDPGVWLQEMHDIAEAVQAFRPIRTVVCNQWKKII